MAKTTQPVRFNLLGYNFDPNHGWPNISIKPQTFTAYMHWHSRSTRRSTDYLTDDNGKKVRVICKICHAPLNIPELQAHQSKCNSCMNLDDNNQNGEVSRAARNRLQTAFDWMWLLSKTKKAYNTKSKSWYPFKIALLTIKLPCIQLHDDKFIKKNMLNEFLTILRKKYHLQFYIWRAEKGNDEILHFHILHDHFINHIDANKIWNKILKHYGYEYQYRKNQQEWHKEGFHYREKYGSRWNKRKQLAAYKRGIATNWALSTGTSDIHSIHSIKNTRAYLAKYISKPVDIREKSQRAQKAYCAEKKISECPADIITAIESGIKGRMMVEGNLWYLSQALSKLKGVVVEANETLQELCRSLREQFPKQYYFTEYCQIFKFNIKQIIAKNMTPLLNPLKQWVSEIRATCFPEQNNFFSTLGIPLTLFS